MIDISEFQKGEISTFVDVFSIECRKRLVLPHQDFQDGTFYFGEGPFLILFHGRRFGHSENNNKQTKEACRLGKIARGQEGGAYIIEGGVEYVFSPP